MGRCPDCDSVKIMAVPPEGDGRCSTCHGTGSGGVLDHLAEMIGGEKSECDECNGTGKCQTCDGTGIVEGMTKTTD